jgi:CHAT domain-containing protein/tetratricopeptide (TPR) repeat protein
VGIAGERRANLEEAIACCRAALQVSTLEVFPVEYAMVQTNLGNAYQDRIAGERRANLEEAIACYQAALQVRTLEAFPPEYAMVQTNLGNAYQDRIAGERRANLEEAIACYQAALQVRTLEAFPVDYAGTQHNLGNAYRARIAGERRANLEEAIACYQTALQVFTLEAFPVDYAMAQNNLGNAYRVRIEEEQRANLEEAIACFHAALGVYTLEAFPPEYAMVQTNLGIAYGERLEGERRVNLEEAIACYQAALQVRTLEAFPVEYANTQTELGIAYGERLEGERRVNLEEAIACYQAALGVYTLEAFPVDYARTQHNLGSAYQVRIEGEQRANLEKAIACYQTALQVFTLEAFPVDYAMAQNNLGNTYQVRIEGEQRANLEEAIACFHAALQVFTLEAFPVDYARTQHNLGNTYQVRIEGEQRANLEQAITCYQAALQVRILKAFPLKHRETQLNCAFIEAERSNWIGAHKAYRGALSAEDYLVALGSGTIGRDVVLREGRDAAVRDGFALIQLHRIAEAAETLEHGRARGLAEAMALDAADPGLIHNDELRARYATAQAQFIAAQKDLSADLSTPSPRHLMKESAEEKRRRSLQRMKAYHQAKNKFDAIVAEVRAAHDPADFMETGLDAAKILQVAEQAGPGHALVYLAATHWGGIAVGVLGAYPSASGEDGFVSLDLPHFTMDFVNHLVEFQLSDDTQHIIGGFIHAQEGSAWGLIQQGWSGATFRQQAETLHAACKQTGQTSTLDAAAQELLTIPAVAHLVDGPLATLSETSRRTLGNTLNHLFLSQELSRCLKALADAGLCQLVSWLQEQNITSLTLIPCGSLAAFPLVAVPLADGRTVGETLPTSIAPSARSLLHDEPTRGKRTGVYAIGDPWSTTQQQLLWGEAEAHMLVELGYQLRGLPAQARVHKAATRTWLIEALQRGLIVDASCHGYFNVSEPLQSALLLAAGEQLTLNEMLNHTADLRGLRLLILSACQTAVLDLRGARDEVHSLSAAMLQAGAQAILAPLWSVDEKATYLLVVRFGQEWLPHMESEAPAAALARAQSWLRTVTNSQLQKWHNFPAPTLQRQCGEESQASTYEEGEKALSVGETHLTAGGAEWQVRADARQPDTDPDAYPYADPIYWAGFQLTGW